MRSALAGSLRGSETRRHSAEIREFVADKLKRHRGIAATRDDVLITTGSGQGIDIVSRLFSPYEFNPLNNNPLRDVLIASVDFEALQKSDCPVKLFLSATNVRTGKVKVFERRRIVWFIQSLSGEPEGATDEHG